MSSQSQDINIFDAASVLNSGARQYFELVKLVQFEANSTAMVRVRALLNGTVVTEATPRHLTEFASRNLHVIFDKYSIPQEMKVRALGISSQKNREIVYTRAIDKPEVVDPTVFRKTTTT